MIKIVHFLLRLRDVVFSLISFITLRLAINKGESGSQKEITFSLCHLDDVWRYSLDLGAHFSGTKKV
ncbi:hypothetical protein DPMN_190979 [Dreissena polymorpha]|uniref:Uncharacterized protein n=1 Tax=Dreissena polymorpha TaxID=45954 RepID=A0A9D3Y0Y6_DREPO|nr:hypothetical protein DPMN_190979 [Dreissena polymorpha]